MALTLDELLALLPDNDTGQISAADMRTIVTELFTAANTFVNSYAYDWTTNSTPADGKLRFNGLWSVASTILLLAELTDDGLAFPFVTLDRSSGAGFRLSTSGQESVAEGLIVGPSVDMGSYRTVPVEVTTLTGPAPQTGTALSFTIKVPPS